MERIGDEPNYLPAFQTFQSADWFEEPRIEVPALLEAQSVVLEQREPPVTPVPRPRRQIPPPGLIFTTACEPASPLPRTE